VHGVSTFNIKLHNVTAYQWIPLHGLVVSFHTLTC